MKFIIEMSRSFFATAAFAMTLLMVAELGSAILVINDNKGIQRRENSKRDHSNSNKRNWANINAQIIHHSKSDKNLKWLDLVKVDKKWSKSDKKAGQWKKEKSLHKSHKNSSHKSHKNASHKSHKNSSHKSHKNSSHKSHKRGEWKAKWEALQQENQKLSSALATTQEALRNAQNETAEWKAKYEALCAKVAELEETIRKLNIWVAELKQKAEAGAAWKAALDKAVVEIAELKKALDIANQRLRYFAALQHKFKRDKAGNWNDKSKSNKYNKSWKNSKSDKRGFQTFKLTPTVVEQRKEIKLNDKSFSDKKSYLFVGAGQ